jgi:hypothetical protein
MMGLVRIHPLLRTFVHWHVLDHIRYADIKQVSSETSSLGWSTLGKMTFVAGLLYAILVGIGWLVWACL